VGGCFLVAPEADPEDGKLDLIYADAMSLGGALRLLPGLFRGRHVRSAAVHTVQTPFVRLALPGGAPMYVDGEFVDEAVTRLEARSIPGGLRSF
jgi:diacylglycerol kinase (ATP)